MNSLTSQFEFPYTADYFLNSTAQINILYASSGDFTTLCDYELPLYSNGDIDFCSLAENLYNSNMITSDDVVYYYSANKDSYVLAGQVPAAEGSYVPGSELFFSNGVRTLNLKVCLASSNSSNSQNFQDQYEMYSQTSSQPTTCDTLVDFQPALQTANIFANNACIMNNISAKNEVPNFKTFNIQSAQFTLPEVTNQPESDAQSVDNKKKRHKERKICEVIDLVYKWRSLYNGFKHQETGQIHKYSLDEAASIVGACKKSLNDYFLVIKQAKKLGFKFESNQSEGFGVMRTFVKKNKGKCNSSEECSPFTFNFEDQTECTSSKAAPKCKRSQKIAKVAAH
eukprot:CAMPEP_0114589906 /NCGR_PEP_ID=MMETSP0125-20121206/12249_1 /TAXON_ID=485358 ORGANISM="Aristerostoma sp., Strain ATCC 50986" /NCGR_SAMPLE_ID=MMETSP0125 /ASSEMBLY_ACC=CAM_ASM_000245 /LENGTH=339 /DNA_ID=CAMNT_0001787051 /DNA_START=100 /DNA_END=1119 /DNA_ORIENTATION=+